MTIASQLKKQGHEEGFQQGALEGIEKGEKNGVKNVAVKLMAEGVNLKTIENVTGLSEAELQMCFDKELD